ncbi:MAG: hypothetical protein HY521_00280 [Proteobacteria bacterium]|nr:hypothetical protein [Pseudomonadota bacterium]
MSNSRCIPAMRIWRLVTALLAMLMVFAAMFQPHSTVALEKPHAQIAAMADSGCNTHYAGAAGTSECANAYTCPLWVPARTGVLANQRVGLTTYARMQRMAAGTDSNPPRRPPKLF